MWCPAPRSAPRRLSSLLAALLIAALPGCSPTHPDRGQGGRFVFPLPIEPATLNFVSGTDQASVLVQRLVADFLVDHNTRLQPIPRLAAGWDQSPDGTLLTFHLRPGVRFHDGAPLTSADVLYTYERIMDPSSHAVGRVDPFLPIAAVDTPDPLTVRVRYKEPYAPALLSWEVPILPAHLYRGADFATAPQNRAPIGTGPYRFVSWEAGRQIALRANDDYWGGRPGLDAFVFRFTPAPDTAFQALLANEIDYARLQPAQWESRRADADFQKRFRDVSYVPLFFYYLAWRGDGSNPFFSDPNVRRAMSLAIDREGYVRAVLKGQGRVMTSPFQEMLPAPPGPASPACDPDAAAALLDRAGWKLDPRTKLRSRGGRPFRFTLLIFTGGEDHVQFSQVAQENLRRIGVDMAIERLDWQTLWARLKSGDYQAAMSGSLPIPDPDSFYGMLHSSQIEAGQNYAAYRDPEVDAWLEAGRRTLDTSVRATIYRRIETRLQEQQPYAFLFEPAVPAVVSARFAGVEPSPQGILGYYPGAAAWRLAAASR